MSGDNTGLTEAWGQVYINGRLIPADEAAVSAFDRGFLYGDGVYETLRVYAGKPFMLDAHLRRMAHGCSVVGLAPPETKEIEEGVRLVLEANGLTDAYLRITVTRGATGRLWSDMALSKPTLLVIAKPLVPRDFGKGLRLVVSRYRTDERSPLSGVKQTGILPKILARAEAQRMGADDALFLDTRGFVAEATSSNVFWVRDGKLVTPSLACGILAGITRQVVMEIAHEQGVGVVEGEFALGELRTADEMFLTSSTWEIAPVRSLDDMEFPEAPGPVTKGLLELYRHRTPA
ncbi:MAG TPA: aminotransferase class IV [Armatimonadota bacterium]|nr:aminotransferase class IV [Armatimonadota bacterium]